ncbi:uncharacterized protein MONBRDRAFT_39386, partial [Monosiga brevicollis MX1]
MRREWERLAVLAVLAGVGVLVVPVRAGLWDLGFLDWRHGTVGTCPKVQELNATELHRQLHVAHGCNQPFPVLGQHFAEETVPHLVASQFYGASSACPDHAADIKARSSHPQPCPRIRRPHFDPAAPASPRLPLYGTDGRRQDGRALSLPPFRLSVGSNRHPPLTHALLIVALTTFMNNAQPVMHNNTLVDARRAIFILTTHVLSMEFIEAARELKAQGLARKDWPQATFDTIINDIEDDYYRRLLFKGYISRVVPFLPIDVLLLQEYLDLLLEALACNMRAQGYPPLVWSPELTASAATFIMQDRDFLWAHPPTAPKPTHSLQPYLDAVRHTLTAAMCMENFSSQHVERHNKPEIEVASSKELLMNPVVVSRSEKERVCIEASINSVRISIAIKQADEIEKILCKKFMRFMMMRAENFFVLRRKPIEGYDISFLITNFHTEQMYKHKLVDFVIQFMTDIDKEISDMKLKVNSRAPSFMPVCVNTLRAYLQRLQSPLCLPAIVEIFRQLVQDNPTAYVPKFEDIVDILIGWATEVGTPARIRESITLGLAQFSNFWQAK